jgi:hypothetical protein
LALNHWAKLKAAKSTYIETPVGDFDDARLANEALLRCGGISIADSAAHADIVLSFNRRTLSLRAVKLPDGGEFPGSSSVRIDLKIADPKTGEV